MDGNARPGPASTTDLTANIQSLLAIAEKQHADRLASIASFDQKLGIVLAAQGAVLVKAADQPWTIAAPWLALAFLVVALASVAMAGWGFCVRRWTETPEVEIFRRKHAGKTTMEFQEQLLANYGASIRKNTKGIARKVRWLNFSLLTMFFALLLLGAELYLERGTTNGRKGPNSALSR